MKRREPVLGSNSGSFFFQLVLGLLVIWLVVQTGLWHLFYDLAGQAIEALGFQRAYLSGRE